MPRFLGRNYYREGLTARKELGARASLTVPLRLKEDEKDKAASLRTQAFGHLEQLLYDDLKPLDGTIDADIVHLNLYADGNTGFSVEPLEWGTRWKAVEGTYVEIVPSSNPDSHSSFLDSQPESQTDLFAVEQFCVAPLTEFSKGRDWKQLEEPLSVHSFPKPLMPTSVGSLLQSLTDQLGLDGCKQYDIDLIADEETNLSEAAVFGHGDRHLQETQEEKTEQTVTQHSPQMFTEKFEPRSFGQAKAEELMSPVRNVDSPVSSPSVPHTENEVVSTARAACVDNDNQADLAPLVQSPQWNEDSFHAVDLDVEDHPKDHPLEDLELSPVTKSDQSSFLALDEMQGKEDSDEGRQLRELLESPFYLQNSSSPLQFDEGYKHVQSPLPCPPGTPSPLLTTGDNRKLEEAVRQGDACFEGIQSLKFTEPTILHKEENLDVPPEPVKDALQLALSVESMGCGWNQQDVDFTWDIAPVKEYLSHLPPLIYPEKIVLPPSGPHVPERKSSFDFKTIEASVNNEPAKMVSQKTDCGTDTAEQPEVKEKPDQTFLPLPMRDSSGDMGSLEPISTNEGLNDEQTDKISTTQLSLRDVASSPKNKTDSTVPSPTQPDRNISVNLSQLDPQTLAQDPTLKYPTHAARAAAETATAEDEKEDLHQPPAIMNWGQHPLRGKLNVSGMITSIVVKDTPSSAPHRPCPLQPVGSQFMGEGCDSSSRKETHHQHAVGENVTAETDDTTSDSGGGPNLEGFDLQFDDEDIMLGSDSFDEDIAQGKVAMSKSPDLLGAGVAMVDPVDNFLMLRDAKVTSTTRDVIKGHTVVKAVPRNDGSSKPHPGVITPMSVLPPTAGDSEQRFVTVSLTGQFQEALQEMESQVQPHLQRLKTEGVVKDDSSFLSLRPDYTRFLLKDRMNKLGITATERSEDELYRSLVTVHTLCTAAHLLQQCCLESAIVHLSAMQDQYVELTGRLEGLRKALFQHQFQAQQSGQLHPKVAALCREIQHHRHTHLSPVKVLVVIRRDQPTLVKTLQSAVGIDGTVVKTWMAGEIDRTWPDGCECVLIWDQSAVNNLVSMATLLVDFEADTDSPLCSTCHSHNLHYVGLSTIQVRLLPQQPQASRTRSDDSPVTVVGSQQLIQHQRLLQLLETRHNIIVLRRDYSSAGRVHDPDVLVNAHKGAVLVQMQQLREQGGLERLMERLATVGLHLSTVWVLMHCLGDNNRWSLDKDTAKKTVQLQALMANLSTACKGFTATYKILMCRTADEVAVYLNHLAMSDNGSPCDTGLMTQVPQLPPEMTKEEKVLLGIPCLNTFSCHLLLSRATVGQMMTMSRDQLRSLLPELPDSVIENLHRVVTMDRGLQLRPQSTEICQPLSDDQQQSQLQDVSCPLPHDQSQLQDVSSPLPHDQSQLNDVCLPQSLHQSRQTNSYQCQFDKQDDQSQRREEAASVSVVAPSVNSRHSSVRAALSSQSEPRAASIDSRRGSDEGFDYVSPEISQQNCPPSLTSAVHGTDRLTPFLLPGQHEEWDSKCPGPNDRSHSHRSDMNQTTNVDVRIPLSPLPTQQDFRAGVHLPAEAVEAELERHSQAEDWSQTSHCYPRIGRNVDSRRDCRYPGIGRNVDSRDCTNDSGVDASSRAAFTECDDKEDSFQPYNLSLPALSDRCQLTERDTGFFSRQLKNVDSLSVDDLDCLRQAKPRATTENGLLPVGTTESRPMQSFHDLNLPLSTTSRSQKRLFLDDTDDGHLTQTSGISREDLKLDGVDSQTLPAHPPTRQAAMYSLPDNSSDFSYKRNRDFAIPAPPTMRSAEEKSRFSASSHKEWQRNRAGSFSEFQPPRDDEDDIQAHFVPKVPGHLYNQRNEHLILEKDADSEDSISSHSRQRNFSQSFSSPLWRAQNMEQGLTHHPRNFGFETSGYCNALPAEIVDHRGHPDETSTYQKPFIQTSV